MDKKDTEGSSDFGLNVIITAVAVFGILALCEGSSAKAEARRKADEEARRMAEEEEKVRKSKLIKDLDLDLDLMRHRDPTGDSYGYYPSSQLARRRTI